MPESQGLRAGCEGREYWALGGRIYIRRLSSARGRGIVRYLRARRVTLLWRRKKPCAAAAELTSVPGATADVVRETCHAGGSRIFPGSRDAAAPRWRSGDRGHEFLPENALHTRCFARAISVIAAAAAQSRTVAAEERLDWHAVNRHFGVGSAPAPASWPRVQGSATGRG